MLVLNTSKSIKTNFRHSHLVSEYFRATLLRQKQLEAECWLTDDPHSIYFWTEENKSTRNKQDSVSDTKSKISVVIVQGLSPVVLSGKVGTGMCGPDRVPLRPLGFTNGPLFLKIGIDIGRVFAKCLIFDEFFLWFTYRLSKSTYACKFRW